jgi:hypothetical protein
VQPRAPSAGPRSAPWQGREVPHEPKELALFLRQAPSPARAERSRRSNYHAKRPSEIEA